MLLVQLPKPILLVSPLKTSWEKSFTRKLQLESIIYAFLRDQQENSIDPHIPIYVSHHPNAKPLSSYPSALIPYASVEPLIWLKLQFLKLLLFSLKLWSGINKILLFLWKTPSSRSVWKSVCHNDWIPLLAFSGQGFSDVKWPWCFKSCRRRFLLPHMPEVQFWGNLWNFINLPLTWLSCLSVLFCFKNRTIHFILVLHCHSLVIFLPSISWLFHSVNFFISIFLTKVLLYRVVRFTHFYFTFFFLDIF